jgi:hypothetical protein
MSCDIAVDNSFEDYTQTFVAVVHPLVLSPVELNSTLALPTDLEFDYNSL